MLVISRKPGESIRFTVPPSDKPQTFIVKVVRLNENAVKIGTDANSCVKVLRTELVDYEPSHPEGESYA
jgi:sRNA-binding carbon storage regulator CsrA